MQTDQNVKSNIFSSFFSKVSTSSLLWIFTFSILTAVSAQVAIPVKPVPFTLQTMMVILSGAFLGAKKGAYSQLLYLFFGCVGLPVFANGAFGFQYLFGPTGGYLLAFPIGAFVTGYFVEKYKSYLSVVIIMFAAEVLIIAAGTFYLNLFFVKDFSEALKVGGIIFSLSTVIKVFAAASIYFGVSKKYSKH